MLWFGELARMRFIGAVHVGVDRIRREPRRALSVLVAAITYQLSVLIAVYCAIHALGISVRTVDNLLSRSYLKLGVSSRDELGDVLRREYSGEMT